MDAFEEAIVKELDEIKKLLDARREVLLSQISSFSDGSHRGWMGRTFALGSIDNAIWHIRQRIDPKGTL